MPKKWFNMLHIHILENRISQERNLPNIKEKNVFALTRHKQYFAHDDYRVQDGRPTRCTHFYTQPNGSNSTQLGHRPKTGVCLQNDCFRNVLAQGVVHVITYHANTPPFSTNAFSLCEGLVHPEQTRLQLLQQRTVKIWFIPLYLRK